MGRTYQKSRLFLGLSVEDNLYLAVLGSRGGHLRLTRKGRRRRDARARARAGRVPSASRARSARLVGSISHGEQRQLEVAMARATEPKLMLLDEPASGLSRGERVALTDLLLELDKSITLILIEHDMDVALRVAQSVTMMHDGRKIVEGTPDEIRANELVHELYLGGRVTDDGIEVSDASSEQPSAQPRTAAPLLAVKDLNVYYGRAHVLQDVSFEMGDEPVALIGRNGMGKTTLCNAIMQMPPGQRDRLDRLRGHASSSGARRTRSPAPGSATCPRAGGCSSRSPSTSTCGWPRRGAAATAGRPTPSTSSSRAWPSAARTAACSSPAASSRCSPSGARCSPTPGC